MCFLWRFDKCVLEQTLFHNIDILCSTSGSNSTESDGLPVHLLNATNKVQYAANPLNDILKMIFLNFPYCSVVYMTKTEQEKTPKKP